MCLITIKKNPEIAIVLLSFKSLDHSAVGLTLSLCSSILFSHAAPEWPPQEDNP